MEAIDFMNQTLYQKLPGSLDDISSHPKFVLIRPDGTIFYFVLSNDGKKITVFGQEKICDSHTDYIGKLVESYFSDHDAMVEDVKKGNLYDNLIQFLLDGNIIFNNITSYQGPLFFLHGTCGQLLIPPCSTEAQDESLTSLSEYIDYFKEIEVKEYHDILNNIKDSYREDGRVAINHYFERKSENKAHKH